MSFKPILEEAQVAYQSLSNVTIDDLFVNLPTASPRFWAFFDWLFRSTPPNYDKVLTSLKTAYNGVFGQRGELGRLITVLMPLVLVQNADIKKPTPKQVEYLINYNLLNILLEISLGIDKIFEELNKLPDNSSNEALQNLKDNINYVNKFTKATIHTLSEQKYFSELSISTSQFRGDEISQLYQKLQEILEERGGLSMKSARN